MYFSLIEPPDQKQTNGNKCTKLPIFEVNNSNKMLK